MISVWCDFDKKNKRNKSPYSKIKGNVKLNSREFAKILQLNNLKKLFLDAVYSK